MSWETEMAKACYASHLGSCEQHYYIYVCCGEECVRAEGDYPFCPEHGGEPMLKCEAEEEAEMEEKQATFHKIMEEWEFNRAERGGRLGQDLFNAVQTHDEETAEDLRRSGVDPFYNDRLIPQAISWLAERYFG